MRNVALVAREQDVVGVAVDEAEPRRLAVDGHERINPNGTKYAERCPLGRRIFRKDRCGISSFQNVFGFRTLPWTTEDIVKAVKDTVRANGFKDCYIRPLLYLDGGGWNLNVDNGKASLSIAAWEWGNYLGEEARDKGIRANISSFTRHHPNVLMTKAKVAGNYANSFLAKTESERLGFQEAIMLDPQGYVAECTGENLFMVRHGKIITPSTAPVLEGVTRHSIHSIAKDMGYRILEQPISRDQLYIADEVFVCGTAAECIGLSEIDFRTIGEGKTGPTTRQIQNVYHDAIRGKLPQYESWCEYVD